MKKVILLLAIFSFASSLFAQSVTISTTTNCFNPAVTVPYAMDFNGRPAFNTATGNLGGVSPAQISVLWTSTRWEIRVGGGVPVYFHTDNTANPPSTGWQAQTTSFPLGTCNVGDTPPTLTGDVALPVSLTAFEAVPLNEAIDLRWETASETNNKGFEIEKSKDGINWEIISFETGNGTSTRTHVYQYMDVNPFFGLNYFRLKQIDFDGQSTYSEIIVLDFLVKNNDWIIAPNPFQHEITIELPIALSSDKIILLYDAFGKKIAPFVLTKNETKHTFNLSHLPQGVYFFQIAIDAYVITHEVVKI